MKKTVLILLFTCIFTCSNAIWGFFAHQKINRLAVFTLPIEMVGFYKFNIQYITENAVNPDKRRYAVENEAPRHYLDADVYGDSAVYKLPRYWNEAVEKYTEDTLQAYGIVPWHIYRVKQWLTDAMRIQDAEAILRLSADLGHYIGDANVPLHTTENYNGQLTNQHGIHGFWESRLPELYSNDYNYFVGNAQYITNTQIAAWDALIQAHEALDSVLFFEKQLSEKMGADKKSSFETRGASTVRVYSKDFSRAYHKELDGMVERQMTRAIKMIGDFWYTCWIDAGQPDLDQLIDFEFSDQELQKRKQELEEWKEKRYQARDHESG
ncbi:zinc dependent phospholipase C family protein [Fulvivirga lutea]|uniref:S1/P1 Nuclease n=1 Tax=Fulvivirga lutea TaxID=2810512 RepID=A0A975A0E7_9BACT|nr:zinc dependent phospholipase C family protein [Fulvivirga lutea]QSE97314.1 S1/P1 Nuclease [Fulvivirga lutea]